MNPKKSAEGILLPGHEPRVSSARPSMRCLSIVYSPGLSGTERLVLPLFLLRRSAGSVQLAVLEND
jgi:hypothetical protein